ncbi:MAG: cupin domain-containing protein [Bdellovibrionota bacterium]
MHILNIYKEAIKAAGRLNYKGGVLELSETFGAKNLGFHVETLDPKNFSCPYHYHEKEEELFLVLEGEAIVRKNNEFRKVGPGDIIFYEVGETSAHNMYNHTDKPFKILAISNNSDTDVCHYPDSKKINSSGVVKQNGEIVDYFKDEEDPAKYWLAHALRGEV